MSKFSAWDFLRLELEETYGIRVQVYGISPNQTRQMILPSVKFYGVKNRDVHTSSTANGSNLNNLIDDDPKTVWSSARAAHRLDDQWFAIWFGERIINTLELVPSMVQGRTQCLPEEIQIFYSRGPNDWREIKRARLMEAFLANGKIYVSLDGDIKTEGILVIAKQLRPDESNNYYFQMAEARVGRRTLESDLSKVIELARRYPRAVFAIGDEPDGSIPPDEYARVYDRYVEAVKRGSTYAKVATAGFTFANRINGESFTQYAQTFYQDRSAPIDEWRFHRFYWPNAFGDWVNDVVHAAKWSVDHGAKMVLGSFGSPDPALASIDMRPYHRQAMALVKNEPNIVDAVYCSFYHPSDSHGLLNTNGQLTDDGKVFIESA